MIIIIILRYTWILLLILFLCPLLDNNGLPLYLVLSLLLLIYLLNSLHFPTMLAFHNSTDHPDLLQHHLIEYSIQSVFINKIVNINTIYLTYSMCSIFCLLHQSRSPMHFSKYYSRTGCESKSHTGCLYTQNSYPT